MCATDLGSGGKNLRCLRQWMEIASLMGIAMDLATCLCCVLAPCCKLVPLPFLEGSIHELVYVPDFCLQIRCKVLYSTRYLAFVEIGT